MAAAANRFSPVASKGRLTDAIRFVGKKVGQEQPALVHRVYELLPKDAWNIDLAISLVKAASPIEGTDLTALGRLDNAIANELAKIDNPALQRAFKIFASNNAAIRGEVKTARKKLRGRRDTIGEVMAFFKQHELEVGTIVDVGVAQGTAGLYEHYPEARILLVDPVPGSEIFMKALCEKYANASYHMVAAGGRRGKMMFSVDPAVSGSRLVETVGSHGFGTDVEVDVVPINELVRETNAPGPYVIKVDTEGAETFVLQGATDILDRTEVLILETRVQPIGVAPELYETLQFLDGFGFVCFDIIDRNYNDAAGFLKQFDMVCVKKDGKFRDRDHYPELRAATNALFYEEIQRKKAQKTKNLAGKPLG